jgi:hypothetical protein
MVGLPRSRKAALMSRLVCEETHGLPPTPKHDAAHKTRSGCLGKLCVNPWHIRWATRSENERDKPYVTATHEAHKHIGYQSKSTVRPYFVGVRGVYLGSYPTLDEALMVRDAYLS